MKLRDCDLHSEETSTPLPEECVFTQPVAYLLYVELRRLRLEVGGVGKVNVHLRTEPAPYDGVVFDGTTALEVEGDLASTVLDAAGPRNRALLAFLVKGVSRVMQHFGVPLEPLEAAQQRILDTDFRIRERIGRATKDVRAVDLMMNWDGVDRHCTLSAVVKQGRTVVGEVPLCTAFLIPDMIKEYALGTSLESPDVLLAEFLTFNDGWRKFGVPNFDPLDVCVGRTYSEPEHKLTLRVDLAGLLRQQPATSNA